MSPYVYRGTGIDVDPEPVQKDPAVFDPSKCGTTAGHKQHRKHGTTPCRACKDATNAYHREYRVRSRSGDTVREFKADRCGSSTGYSRHLRHGVPVCPRCRAERNAYKAALYARKQAA